MFSVERHQPEYRTLLKLQVAVCGAFESSSFPGARGRSAGGWRKRSAVTKVRGMWKRIMVCTSNRKNQDARYALWDSSATPPVLARCSGLTEAALNFFADAIIFSIVASKEGFSPLWNRSGLMRATTKARR